MGFTSSLLWQILLLSLIFLNLFSRFIYHGKGGWREVILNITPFLILLVLGMIFWRFGFLSGFFSLICYFLVWHFITDRIILFIYQKIIYRESKTLRYKYFLWRSEARKKNKEMEEELNNNFSVDQSFKKELEDFIVTLYTCCGSEEVALDILSNNQVLKTYIIKKYIDYKENSISDKQLARKLLDKIGYYDY